MTIGPGIVFITNEFEGEIVNEPEEVMEHKFFKYTELPDELTTRYDSEPCPTVLDINRECPYFLAFSGFAVYGKDFLKFWV